MKFKVGDIVVIKQLDKKIWLRNVSYQIKSDISNRWIKNSWIRFKEKYKPYIGLTGKITEINNSMNYPYEVKNTFAKPDSQWTESELRKATKKEIQKYKQQLVEEQI